MQIFLLTTPFGLKAIRTAGSTADWRIFKFPPLLKLTFIGWLFLTKAIFASTCKMVNKSSKSSICYIGSVEISYLF